MFDLEVDFLSGEKYTCPVCGTEMIWTGDISQDLKKNYCAILFVYRCRNYNCNHKAKYERLDSDGEQLKYLDDMSMMYGK